MGFPLQVSVVNSPSSGAARTYKKKSSVPILLASLGLLGLAIGAGIVAVVMSLSQPTPIADTKREAVAQPSTSPQPATDTKITPPTTPVAPPVASGPSAADLAATSVPPSTGPTILTPASPAEEEKNFAFNPAAGAADPAMPTGDGVMPSGPATTPPGNGSGTNFNIPAAEDSPDFVPPGAKADAEFVAAILQLHTDKKLLVKKEYPTLRKLFADRFERLHGDMLKQGYGADAAEMETWLAANPEIREEFYLALDPTYDKLVAAGTIFNTLRKQFPEKIVPYYNLAIAVAVVWDDPNRGPYDYVHHCNRCHSVMPTDLMNAIDNFQFYVDAEPVMEGRIRYVPWEFLRHLVNHVTPKAERMWAIQNYAQQRSMFGKCYSTVPYDSEMLATSSRVCKLDSKDYTLPNIKNFGGVCAMQADYAARVGKSIGVASEYVGGESNNGDLHAWVMWIELKQATPTGLVFTLESHGRYSYDKYYVGTLRDPQTGEQITDRDLELRLQTVGMDTIAKRHTALVMQSFAQLKEQGKWDVNQQLGVLSQIITYSPGCEEAWLAAARIARENSGDKTLAKQVDGILDRLFRTFIRVPDFTWRVFGDLAAYHPEGKARNILYEKLIALYVSSDRPDLACEARLVYSDMLVAQDRKLDAVQGLAATILSFPSEGRYVPLMLDKLELLCQGVPGADKHIIGFYTQVLPLVPKFRGSTATPYAIKMYERGISTFQQYGQPGLAEAARLELEAFRLGKPPKA